MPPYVLPAATSANPPGVGVRRAAAVTAATAATVTAAVTATVTAAAVTAAAVGVRRDLGG
ncbi:hypothetical protein [Micromonospora sp. CP22]|uniref:hypothetical protein n=1 Tax=Micromonospora sp. CP22 TaxID=2580517 RepID=UPI0018AD2808|nr:hypothetical protein [Micromonospora sp. CP22]